MFSGDVNVRVFLGSCLITGLAGFHHTVHGLKSLQPLFVGKYVGESSFQGFVGGAGFRPSSRILRLPTLPTEFLPGDYHLIPLSRDQASACMQDKYQESRTCQLTRSQRQPDPSIQAHFVFERFPWILRVVYGFRILKSTWAKGKPLISRVPDTYIETTPDMHFQVCCETSRWAG